MNRPSDPKSDENRPLAGIRVLVTRPGTGPDSLSDALEYLGASVVRHPLIEFAEPSDLDEIKQVGGRLNEFSLLVFLSPRAASAAHQHFLKDTAQILPYAAIGPGTVERLESHGFCVLHVPPESNSESMAEILIDLFREQDLSRPILIFRADRGSDVLPTELARAGIPFEELAVYRSIDVEQADPTVMTGLANGNFDWLTITSSSIASNAAKLFGAHLGETKVVSISPTTTKVAEEAGLKVAAEATDYNTNGIVDAILRFEENSQGR